LTALLERSIDHRNTPSHVTAPGLRE
jgi:hypothetical protein